MFEASAICSKHDDCSDWAETDPMEDHRTLKLTQNLEWILSDL